MGAMQGKKDCFLNPFMHRSTEVAYPEPTKVFLKLSHSFCSSRTLPQVTSQDASFMLDIPGYIREKVNVNRCANYLTLKFNTLESFATVCSSPNTIECTVLYMHDVWKNTMCS